MPKRMLSLWRSPSRRRLMYLLSHRRLSLQGLFQALVTPCVSSVLGAWVAPLEKPMASSISSIGGIIGNVLAALATPLLAARSWQASFYLVGLMYLTLSLVWLVGGASSPQESRWASPRERTYLTSALRVGKSRQRGTETPPLSLLCSCGLLSVIQAHGSLNYIYYILMAWLPSYLHLAYRLPLEEVLSTRPSPTP